ncbi:UDP-N-acetylmuramoylalanyl-D-glutamyl-2,6-diaminopimelate--D-alanyl-D-alanine ligase [Rhizobiaceae bacterium BDR2-2]|uniref:UDP-N-acetylmuramoyl-tripeptide--D-alanyl-D-alanine ligase n=1 Tax=Ectorhizobium quercum TaxID=2965071 RepID=A0AAE3MWZ7_9HYPH|nr:UDP-N-acetylmuramoylalanyl-D-glutamyl-2,6-diaminopimelate--D-alanyl-D-alanine ligase [Ectorhizobium quercum]MCX8996469.1 UDP-N-acetylmuramoylalanyl-D-glutamyl-2,6-diaminopimelate--D-alanyl-D-alanine ligase [Ectorhizobium quercum]
MDDFLWTSEELVTAMAGRPLGSLPGGVTGISIDSRSVKPGDAFFAIRGERVDGHDFAGVAMANGAALIVVAEAKLPALGRLTCAKIVVEDVLAALERLGVAARKRSQATVLAVTGSVGKTTTKEMLRGLLAPSGEVHAAVASFNNHWGVPLTLARMPVSARYGVFEIGMNHPGEIRPLVKMVEPHVAIVTTIAPAHLGNFASIEEIAAAKAEIFEGVLPGGAALINRDNPEFEQLEEAARAAGVTRIFPFGQHVQAHYRMEDFHGEADRSAFTFIAGVERFAAEIGAPGRHVAENAVAALGAVQQAEADLDAAIDALALFGGVKGRGERHRRRIGDGAFMLIDESYNANPASMRAAIAVLAAAETGGEGRRIAVLGDMLEMGAHSDAVHADLAGPLLAAGISHVWLAGPAMAHLRDALPESVSVEYREKTGDLASFVAQSVLPGDAVMVKSSLGLGFGKIVAALLDKFPPLADTQADTAAPHVADDGQGTP